MHVVVRALVTLSCGFCLLRPFPAAAREPGNGRQDGSPFTGAAVAPEKLKVCHLRLEGDLDNTRLVGQFSDELTHIRAEHVDLLVLEIGANRWRTDVVDGLIRAASSAGLGAASGASKPITWIVWLNDPADGRVGTGAAALAAVADRCYLGVKTEIAHEPADDARDLAPASLAGNWEQVEQDLQGVIWARLNARAGDLLLASALPFPRQPLWVVNAPAGSASPMRIVSEDPARRGQVAIAAMVEPVTGVETGGMKLRLDATAAVGIGLAAGQAKDVGQIITARHVLPRPLVRRELRSGLADARARLTREIGAIDAAREQSDKSLDEAERLRGNDAVRQKARTGVQAASVIDDAMKRLLEVEALTAEYPELLRSAPPGQTPVGMTESRLTLAWAAAFQSRRQALADLRNRATRLAG